MSYMTFILQANNLKQGYDGEKVIQSTNLESGNKADLLISNNEKYADNFKMYDSSNEKSEYNSSADEPIPYDGDGTCCYTRTTRTGVFNEQEEASKVDLGWKLEAVRGYVQNEQEHMSGWWKDLSTNRASDFTTAHIDFI